jgi:hypothetical protein
MHEHIELGATRTRRRHILVIVWTHLQYFAYHIFWYKLTNTSKGEITSEKLQITLGSHWMSLMDTVGGHSLLHMSSFHQVIYIS